MNHQEFENYLNHCKKDLAKAYNISKKHYLYKWQKNNDEESKLFGKLMEIEMNNYLKKKIS